ncbi:MAG: 2-dehydro-3-deoxyphosphogluconate aldolase / (4S)-4-hydroxy-2-oxoglutarate aldolase [Pseudonocardiales bacterium]|nr:2-dehydro-3-deoxyphosphogluconate aldolase / (4S)-4-hydroxy-2-oxoglutarate aldolase [Pseudonocardiales bacterium]
MPGAAPRNSSSSLRRALGLIEVVATRHAAGGCTLTELAADAGLARSTVARLVTPLLDHGYVEVEPASGRHRLGVAIARLGSTYVLGPGTGAAAPVSARVPMSEALVTTRVVAILRAEHASRAEAVVDTLVEGGIRCLELTMTTRGALEVVERLAARIPAGVDLGMGTVLTAAEVDRAVDAGARFVVSPSVVPAVIAAAADRGIASYPGALTPTEIHQAWTAGASAVKLFPAGALGPDYLKAVRAPLPDIPIVPTGGVGTGSVRAWLDAGACAVGMGSPLIGDALTSDGDLGALSERARAVCAAVAGAGR